MEAFRFVDAHVHFYDMKHPKLYYAHWQPDEDHPVLGPQTRKLGNRNYLAEDFVEEASSHGMVKAVHVQAAIGSEDPVDETEWLQEAYSRTKFPQAIVGHVDLRSSDAESQIERHMQFENFKGVRDFSHGDYLVNDDFKRGFSLLSKYGLISSVGVSWPDMNKLMNLAKTYPNTTIVIDHAGIPMERTQEYFDQWRKGMSMLAGQENIICKISGLGMGDYNWTIESIRPYVETCIDLFGCKRSLFATNWPIDSLWSCYADVIKAYRKLTQTLTSIEREAMFAGNTERIYKI